MTLRRRGSALRGIGAHGSGLVARLSIRNCFEHRPLGRLAFLSYEQQESRDHFGTEHAGVTWLNPYCRKEINYIFINDLITAAMAEGHLLMFSTSSPV